MLSLEIVEEILNACFIVFPTVAPNLLTAVDVEDLHYFVPVKVPRLQHPPVVFLR